MIDLHIHTIATPHHSTWTPDALVDAALRAGLRAIAVSDHNTTASVAATQAAGRQCGLAVVSGVEIDSGFPAVGQSPLPVKMWHTLVYGVEPDQPELQALCAEVFERNQADAEALRVELVGRGFALAGLDALGRPPNVADVGAALARHNPIERAAGEVDESAGMRYILTQVEHGYRPLGVDEVIAVAHHCGGIAVLAHPGRSKGIYAIPADEADIRAMAAAGLDGIEVYYPTHTNAQRDYYLQIANQFGLLVSGGSDSHHPSQPLAAVSYEQATVLARLLRYGFTP
jgi:predicted metal-dependent phosphoesterase TrpH